MHHGCPSVLFLCLSSFCQKTAQQHGVGRGGDGDGGWRRRKLILMIEPPCREPSTVSRPSHTEPTWSEVGCLSSQPSAPYLALPNQSSHAPSWTCPVAPQHTSVIHDRHCRGRELTRFIMLPTRRDPQEGRHHTPGAPRLQHGQGGNGRRQARRFCHLCAPSLCGRCLP